MVESESVEIVEDGEEGREWRVGERGCFVEAAVEGLMSWVGEGWRFMDADWSVEAISMAGLDIVRVVVRKMEVCEGPWIDEEDLTSVPRYIGEKGASRDDLRELPRYQNLGRLCD